MTERKCIVSGEIKSKDELLRFTRNPETGEVIPDFKKKLPGKGVYVSISKTMLTQAVEKGLFSRAFKTKSRAGAGFADMIENLLRKNGLETISLARKAGVLITGFEKVIEALKKDKIAFVLEANNAGNDGHNKIVSKAKNLEIFDLYSSEELDEALDKVNTVHVAFIKSDMAKMVLDKLKKLKAFGEN